MEKITLLSARYSWDKGEYISIPSKIKELLIKNIKNYLKRKPKDIDNITFDFMFKENNRKVSKKTTQLKGKTFIIPLRTGEIEIKIGNDGILSEETMKLLITSETYNQLTKTNETLSFEEFLNDKYLDDSIKTFNDVTSNENPTT